MGYNSIVSTSTSAPKLSNGAEEEGNVVSDPFPHTILTSTHSPQAVDTSTDSSDDGSGDELPAWHRNSENAESF
jgi:hypothetical protein